MSRLIIVLWLTKSFSSYGTRVSNNFRLEKGNFFASFYNFESRCKNTVTLLIVDSHAHRALSFGIYRTIVLRPKQPSFEKNTPLVFHSTNLTTDGSRLFFLVVVRKFFPGTLSFGSYQTSVSNNFPLTKSQFYGWFDYMECMHKKTVIPLSVGSNVHQDTDIRYLSNDSFRSSTAFNREDCPFGVSYNKLNDRWKQTVFSSSRPQKVSPGMMFL